MKKMTKLIGTVIAGAMLMSALPASAEVSGDYPYDEAVTPTKWVVKSSKSAMATDGTYYSYLSPYAKDGNNSLYIDYNIVKTANYYLEVKSEITSALNAGTKYEVEFWTYGDVPSLDDWSLKYQIGGAMGVPTKNETINGWTRFSYSFTPSADITSSEIVFVMVQGMSDFLIDNAVLKAEGTETNLLADGGFESVAVDGSKAVPEKGSYVLNQYTTKYSTASGKNQNSFINYLRPTKRYARTGNYGLYVMHGTSDAANEMSINGALKNKLSAGTEYTIDYWTTSNVQLNWGYGLKLLDQTVMGPLEAVQSANGWNQYSYTWTPSSDITGSYNWITIRYKNGFILDDIRIYPSSSTNPDSDNLLADGGFEDVVEYPFDASIKAENWMLTKQLTSTASDSNADEDDYGTRAFANVSSSAKRGETGYGALLVMNYGSATSNCNVAITQSVEFKADETYNLEFYVKGHYGSKAQIKIGFGPTEKMLSNCTEVETTEDGWTKYTLSGITGVSGSTFRLGATWNVTGVCIDDVTLTREGEETNLLKNGSFDRTYKTTYSASKPVFELLNEDGSVNKTITEIEPGTVQVTTAIRNVSAGPAFNAATIVALYKNGRFVNVSMLERKYAESPVNLDSDLWETTVTVPESIEGESYSIKVMYWDGMGTLHPIGDMGELK